MFDILRKYSSNPIEDQKKLIERVVYNYLIGNTDAHIKNFSLLYGKDMKLLRLAPAYDIVSTRIYKSTSDMSFFIGDDLDLRIISRNTFVEMSGEIGIGHKVIEKPLIVWQMHLKKLWTKPLIN